MSLTNENDTEYLNGSLMVETGGTNRIYVRDAPSWLPSVVENIPLTSDSLQHMFDPEPPPSKFRDLPVHWLEPGCKAFQYDWIEEHGTRITGMPTFPVPVDKLYGVVGFPHKQSRQYFIADYGVVIPDSRHLRNFESYAVFQTEVLNVYFTTMQWYEFPKSLVCAVTDYPFA